MAQLYHQVPINLFRIVFIKRNTICLSRIVVLISHFRFLISIIASRVQIALISTKYQASFTNGI